MRRDVLMCLQSATDAFVLGAIAKLVATLVTFPYLLVKSRLQVRLLPSHPLSSPSSFYLHTHICIG